MINQSSSTVKTILIPTVLITILWVIFGAWLFVTRDGWAIGELGDFFGGGLAAATVILIIWTARLQLKQIAQQQREMEESSIFRTFEVLKPELEGLSVRIISKAVEAGLIHLESDFDFLLKKYYDREDRTVFLREMQKNAVVLRKSMADEHEELRQSILRFRNMVRFIRTNLETVSADENDYLKIAVLSSEVMETDSKVFSDEGFNE